MARREQLCRRVKVCSSQCTKPRSGGLRLTSFFFFLRIACGFGFEALVFDHVLGCHRRPRSRGRRSPLRPARPLIWWKSRAVRMPVLTPPYLQSWVNSTVRIGTLTPTPSVSVPQITLSKPFLRELLDQHAVLRQQVRRGADRCHCAAAF